MLKHRTKAIVSVAAFVFVLGLFLGGSAITSKANSGTQPGSVDDPLITKSYLEEQLRKLTGQPIRQQPGAGSGSSAAENVTVVKLEPGQILYAGAGTELIVRTGKTIAVSNDENGIPDVTAGKDIAAGTAVETNHLLLFPRDGRGIKPDPKSKADIYVMVKGSYILLKEDGTKTAP